MDLMRSLAPAASSTGKGRYDSVVARLRREVGVVLCKGNLAPRCHSTSVSVSMLVFLGFWCPLQTLNDVGNGSLLVLPSLRANAFAGLPPIRCDCMTVKYSTCIHLK
jgi:hypothetical protein